MQRDFRFYKQDYDEWLAEIAELAIEKAEQIIAAALPEGWSLALMTGWGATIQGPGKDNYYHDEYDLEKAGFADLIPILNFADEVIETWGGTNEIIRGTNKGETEVSGS